MTIKANSSVSGKSKTSNIGTAQFLESFREASNDKYKAIEISSFQVATSLITTLAPSWILTASIILPARTKKCKSIQPERKTELGTYEFNTVSGGVLTFGNIPFLGNFQDGTQFGSYRDRSRPMREKEGRPPLHPDFLTWISQEGIKRFQLAHDL